MPHHFVPYPTLLGVRKGILFWVLIIPYQHLFYSAYYCFLFAFLFQYQLLGICIILIQASHLTRQTIISIRMGEKSSFCFLRPSTEAHGWSIGYKSIIVSSGILEYASPPAQKQSFWYPCVSSGFFTSCPCSHPVLGREPQALWNCFLSFFFYQPPNFHEIN